MMWPEEATMRFRPYHPDRAYLLPPSVADELGGDHLCFWVTQQTTEHAALLPTLEGVRQRCGETPAQVSADSDFFALAPQRELERQGVDAYVPGSTTAYNLTRWWNVLRAAGQSG
jgi:hypothetical protein